MQFAENLQKVPFKAAVVTQLDETAMHCDLVLPLLSPLEDFGTHVPLNQSDGIEIAMQQPLMEKLYPETRSFGDVLIDLLKADEARQLQDLSGLLRLSEKRHHQCETCISFPRLPTRSSGKAP